MPIRTAPDPPRYDASVQRSVKNIYDRDPVLIPQLFADPWLPWYRRRAGILLAVIGLMVVAAMALVVYRYGLAGTGERVERVGIAFMRGFTRIVAP